MLEGAFEYEFHGQPEILPTVHDGWHDGWLSPGHGHFPAVSGVSGPGHPNSTVPSSSLASGRYSRRLAAVLYRSVVRVTTCYQTGRHLTALI